MAGPDSPEFDPHDGEGERPSPSGWTVVAAVALVSVACVASLAWYRVAVSPRVDSPYLDLIAAVATVGGLAFGLGLATDRRSRRAVWFVLIAVFAALTSAAAVAAATAPIAAKVWWNLAGGTLALLAASLVGVAFDRPHHPNTHED